MSRGERGVQGTPSLPRDFSGGKRSWFLWIHQHFQPCRSIPGQLGPVAGRDGHQAGTLSPGMRVTFSIPNSTDVLQHEPRTRSGSTLCCSSPDSAGKAQFGQIFQKGQFPVTSVCGGATFVSSSGSRQSFRSKAGQGRVPQSWGSHSPGSATPFQPPDPAGIAPSPPLSY